MRRFIVLLAGFAALVSCGPRPPIVAPAEQPSCAVTRVVDGDTIAVSCAETTIRLLLINTPEIAHGGTTTAQCGGDAAKSYLESRLPGGTAVRLQAGKRDKDKYGRLLRYVFLGDELVNETLVREGYAERYRSAEDHTYEARIVAAEMVAKAAQRGVWVPGCRPK